MPRRSDAEALGDGTQVKNGTPPMRKQALRQLTDKAREFGAGPLFNQVMSTLEYQSTGCVLIMSCESRVHLLRSFVPIRISVIGTLTCH
jgi:hypothetical protein